MSHATQDTLRGYVLDETYRVDEWLAEGGMATIYRGTQLLLDRPVAIKTLRGDWRRDPEAHRRFMREIELSRRITHPNVVRVYDGGVTPGGRHYMVMEFLVGDTLARRVPEGGFALAKALELFVQLCDGVEAIHKHGLLHRDLKPSNVFLCDGQPTRWTSGVRVKVLDFGLVRQVDDRAAHSLTRERSVLGTAGWLSPEQIESTRPPDQRADIYSLGALLVFMLTGSSPFASPSARAVIGHQLDDGPSAKIMAQIPAVEGLAQIAGRALRREPGERFPSVAALREAILELSLAGSEHDVAARLTSARPGMPRESEFHTDAIPLDDLDDRAAVVDDYPAPARLIANSILDVLRAADGPLSTAEVRDRLRHEAQLDIDAYIRVLETLADDHLVIAGVGSWRIGRG